MTKMFRILSTLMILAMLSACTNGNMPDSRRIAVSILPQKYFLEQIAGNDFDCDVLVAPGASHETYDPTPRQMAALANTSIWLTNGYLAFEDQWKEKFRQNNPALQIFDLSEGIEPIHGHDHNHDQGETGHHHCSHGGIDPHYWLSARESRIIATNLCKALVNSYPERRQKYETNLENLLARLDSLDRYADRKLAGTPARTFMIFHPALTYFARDYGLEQVAIEKDGKSPSAKSLREFIDIARRENIRLILVQSQFDQENAATIAREIGGRSVQFDPMDGDWLDNMYHIVDLLHEGLQNR